MPTNKSTGTQEGKVGKTRKVGCPNSNEPAAKLVTNIPYSRLPSVNLENSAPRFHQLVVSVYP